MYVDALFERINISGSFWIIIGLLYALSDYLFNLIFCFITGGLAECKLKRISFPLGDLFSRKRTNQEIASYFATFKAGAFQRIKDYREDKLSYIWPLTILAIPTMLYGITKTTILESTLRLSYSGIPIESHRLTFFKASDVSLQYYLWLVAIIISFSTFIRYRYQRTEMTWFSKSITFHLFRIILFNIPLTYFFLNIILVWLDYSSGLISLLQDDSISYSILHPDLMYGLKDIYNTILGFSVAMVFLSLLPAIMLLREGREKYKNIYFVFLYSGIIVVLIYTLVIIKNFDSRLALIKENALAELVSKIPVTPNELIDQDHAVISIASLSYYLVIMNLPGEFPRPFWFDYLIGSRLILLAYEFFNLFSPASEKIELKEIINRIFSRSE